MLRGAGAGGVILGGGLEAKPGWGPSCPLNVDGLQHPSSLAQVAQGPAFGEPQAEFGRVTLLDYRS